MPLQTLMSTGYVRIFSSMKLTFLEKNIHCIFNTFMNVIYIYMHAYMYVFSKDNACSLKEMAIATFVKWG